MTRAAADSDLAKFFEQHYTTKERLADASANTMRDYRIQLRHLQTFHKSQGNSEPLKVGDLSDELIRGAINWQMQRNRTVATADKLRRFACAVWSFAFDEGIREDRPRVKSLRQPKRQPACWSIDEFSRLLDAARRLPGHVGPYTSATFFRALLLTVFNSGARISAVMSIRKTWVDIESGLLRIDASVQKDKEDQVVTLRGDTVEAINRIMPNVEAELFESWTQDRTRPQWPKLNEVLAELIVSAGLRPNRQAVTRRDYWHKIRRTFATYVTRSAGIETAREMLGHSSVDTTWRYVDRSKLETPSQAELLPSLEA